MGHQLSTFSKGTGRRDEEYGIRNHITSKSAGGTINDNESGNSTLPLRDPTAIRKTTEIDVSR